MGQDFKPIFRLKYECEFIIINKIRVAIEIGSIRSIFLKVLLELDTDFLEGKHVGHCLTLSQQTSLTDNKCKTTKIKLNELFKKVRDYVKVKYDRTLSHYS